MFSDNETSIVKALVEEELSKVMILSNRENEKILFNKYNHSLSKILIKMDMDSFQDLTSECCSSLMKDFASRHAV